MTARHALAAFIAILSTVSAASGHASELTATFIGNMAFHITDGKVAILTDFPYESGAFGYMQWSPPAVPPGPRPLCLITHGHKDHFAPDLAPRYCGRVIGPKDVTGTAGVEVWRSRCPCAGRV